MYSTTMSSNVFAGSAYGKGIYFAKDASLSADRYSKTDTRGLRYVFYSRVLTGFSTIGKCDMTSAPFRTTNTRYDSTVDRNTNPNLHVIYNDCQAYPDYLVTFR